MTDLCLDLLGAAGPCIVDGSFARTQAFASSLAALRNEGGVQVSAATGDTGLGARILADWPASRTTVSRGNVRKSGVAGLERYREVWRERLPPYG